MKALCVIGLMILTLQAAVCQCDSIATTVLDSIENAFSYQRYEVVQELLEYMAGFCEDEPDSSISGIRMRLAEARLDIHGGQYVEGLARIRSAHRGILKRENVDLLLLAELYNTRASAELRTGKFEHCKNSADSARMFALQDQSDLVPLQMALNLMGNAHQQMYQAELAIALYKESKQLAEKMDGPESMRVARLDNNLANCFHLLRQYAKAISYLKHALKIYEKTYGKNYYGSNTPHFNLAINYRDNGQFEQAIFHFEESSRLMSIEFPGHHYIAENYQCIADCYRHLDDFEKAVEKYQTAAEIFQASGRHYNEIGQLHSAIAKLYADQSQYSAALVQVEKGIAITRQTLGQESPRLASMIQGRTAYLKHLGRLDEALHSGERSLEILNYKPEAFDPIKSADKSILYHSLGGLAEVHHAVYQRRCAVKHLHLGLRYYQQAISLLRPLRNEMENESSRHALSRQSMWLYEGAVGCAFDLWTETDDVQYAHLAFQFSEQSRQSTALEAILARSTTAFPGVPIDIVLREQKLSKKVASLEIALHVRDHTESDQQLTLATLQDSLFTLREQLAYLLDSIEITYPEYYEHRFRPTDTFINSWQGQLKEGQCLVEFLDTEEHIYRFVMTKSRLELERISVSQELRDALRLFETHTSNPDSILPYPEHSQEILQENGRILYQHLLAGVSKYADLTSLIIIPDGMEAHLVFDILVTMNDQYLFNEYEIQYAQSVQMWLKQRHSNNQPTIRFAGFAPAFGSPVSEDTLDSELWAAIVRSGNLHLPMAAQEVKEIQQIVGGRTYLASEATKESLAREAGQAQVLHLSTHAFLDEKNPAASMFLLTNTGGALGDQRLLAAEICHLDLQADLAVLSACHTGSGRVSRGEGVLSLGRAFAFAGVPAIVQSLWKVPDQAASEFMPYFYRALKSGQGKHEALNHARNSYLAQTKISKLHHPYFWAGFILYGNSDPIDFVKQVNWRPWIVGACIFFLGILIVIYKRRGGISMENIS